MFKQSALRRNAGRLLPAFSIFYLKYKTDYLGEHSMNRFVSAFAVLSTLLSAQGCSFPVKSGEAPAQTQETPGQPSMAQMDGHMEPPQPMNHGGSSGGEHNDPSHGNSGTPATSLAKLTVSSNIAPNKPVSLVIDIRDSAGKAITNFDTFQEKLMHLIAVSDDLEFFSHIHPTYKGNGRFEVEASFPKSGGYTLFSDYKPAGQIERVSVLKTAVTGTASPAPAADINLTQTFGNTKVQLALPEATVKAGKEVMLVFNVRDTATGQKVTDLQTYLGETGHLVIIRQSADLKASDYIHAHPHGGTPAGEVHFMTHFPQPGKYKLWGQFNRNGQIVTADFWVNVL
ncbi:MAG: hypothetical protein KME26_16400 [Oscillatoria princeps RMCB-10]|nr:hypothetical protein [Oscillatoria princeps RMCB-10]